MLIKILFGKLQEYLLASQLYGVLCKPLCFHNIIRGDPTTAVDHSAPCSLVFRPCRILFRVMVKINAFLFFTLEGFELILRLVLPIRPLDQATGWCVISCCRQAERRSILQIELPLHKSFSETRFTHNQAAIPILYRTSHDFAGGCRSIINQDNQGNLFELAVA